MSPQDLDEKTRRAAVTFLDRYLRTSADIDQLRSDNGDDRWGDGVTNDPAVWFEWVQACWEAQGAIFTRALEAGENEVRWSTYSESLVVPYDGSDPVGGVRGAQVAAGEERRRLRELRAVLRDWTGSLEEFRRAL